MSEEPYSKFDGRELILRDELAIERTLLANERTLLAYLRSGIALVIAGVSMIHFASEGWFWTAGMASVIVGVLAKIVGIYRFRKVNKSVLSVRRRFEENVKGVSLGDA